MSSPEAADAPEEIRLIGQGRTLVLAYADGSQAEFSAEYLRVESPSAEVQGHGGGRQWIGGKQAVRIIGIEPVGNYAIRPTFDDGHDSGLFTWAYLWKLEQHKEEIWSKYLAEIAKRGLTRS